MKRASYRAAIYWIAMNDSAADHDALEVEAAGSLVTSVLVADLFDVSCDKVGKDIVRIRKQHFGAKYVQKRTANL